MSATQVQVLVLRTAGINCDGETVRAFERAGASVSLVHLHVLISEPARLDSAHVLVIPGGFSYGDYVAAGRIFGAELKTHLRAPLAEFAARGGFILGICNGFQVLTETGLLLPEPEKQVALYGNASDRFECRWVHLRSEDSACPWLQAGDIWPVPVAHAEGRFAVRDAETLKLLRDRRQIALRYVTSAGGSPEYPDNPNGAIEHIAGICDPTGRILGLMPHPERNLSPWNHPQWTRMAAREEGEGLRFFRRMVECAADLLHPVG